MAEERKEEKDGGGKFWGFEFYSPPLSLRKERPTPPPPPPRAFFLLMPTGKPTFRSAIALCGRATKALLRVAIALLRTAHP